MKTLIITEKPKVSQRIAYALPGDAVKKRYGRVPYFLLTENGDETYIASAAGHLYSLKQNTEGYDYPTFDISWKPLYEIEKGKYYTKGYINALESLSKGIDRFIIATDWDIEGELLGFNALRFSAGSNTAKRMHFSTLVSHDLRRAYEELGEVDSGLVDAGETRHIMDWFWGINISRALMHSAMIMGSKISISAGRVQTPALSILVEREREIISFVSEKFYELFAHLKLSEGNVKARYKKGRIIDKNAAEKILAEAKTDSAKVLSVERTETKRFPPVPFDLGELQSEAYRAFRYNPKRTQSIAQLLYESGLISYPRTSSQKYPPSIGFRRLIETLSKIEGFELAKKLLDKQKLYPRQGKKDDPAHPAIYPTGLSPKKLSKEEEKLYGLIVHRFLSTFGEPTVLENTSVEVTLNNHLFVFEGLEIKSIGWLEFYPYTKIKEVILPKITSGDSLAVIKLEIKEGETQAPNRFNPSSLIRKLEEKGLGTKATRADIVDTLYRRQYIRESKIQVTEAGMAVVKALEENVPAIVDEDLTKRFDGYVEQIRLGETSKEAVIEEAKTELIKIIEEFKKKEKAIGSAIHKAFIKTKGEVEIIGKCSECEGDLKIIRNRKTGKQFLGCSNYPKCKNSFPLPQSRKVSPSDKQCQECGLPMINVHMGRKKILSCIDFNCPSKQKR